MVKFVRFNTEDGQSVFVNADRVAYVSETIGVGGKRASIIPLNDKERLQVKGSANTNVTKLQD